LAAIYLIDQDSRTYERLLEIRLQVQWFSDLEDFLAGRIEDSGQEVVVADVQQCGTDGVELIAKLRQFGVQLPVILVCQDADVSTAVRAIRGGAADFFEKPIDAGLLAAAIRRAQRQARIGEPA
jgi:FixJ family two-component response regulator